MTEQEIDLIAADGMRNAAGGIYATRVYEFARAVEAHIRAEPVATVDTTPAGWAQLLIRGIVVSSKYGQHGHAELAEMARRLNAAHGVLVPAGRDDSQQVPMVSSAPSGGKGERK